MTRTRGLALPAPAPGPHGAARESETMKTIKISDEHHRKLRIVAAEAGISIQAAAERAIDGLRTPRAKPRRRKAG